MLGHKVWQQLAPRMEVAVCVRKALPADLCRRRNLPEAETIVESQLTDFEKLRTIFLKTRPDIVVNCIGVVAQPASTKELIDLIDINSVLPHKLAELCTSLNCRLIHISSDGVFSGSKGNYAESDIPDASDPYGRSKILGEIREGGLNIRTSIIGSQLIGQKGLFEWLCSQRGKQVTGYAGYIFSGMTTNALSKIIGKIIESGFPDSAAAPAGLDCAVASSPIARFPLEGTVHIGSDSISKYDLLCKLNEVFALDCKIAMEKGSSAQFAGVIDRSLDSSKFFDETTLNRPTLDEMLGELKADREIYCR